MKISIEMSYYPLNEEFIPHIKKLISKLNTYSSLKVQTNGMSTQIFGEYDDVMQSITTEIKDAFELPHSVIVMKIINADLQ